jgi:hypothetical protein
MKVAEVSFLLLLLSQLEGLVLKSSNEPMLPKINTTMAALGIYGVNDQLMLGSKKPSEGQERSPGPAKLALHST